MDYQTFKIQPDFQILIDEEAAPFRLTDAEAGVVEGIWQAEKRLKGDKLFNGRILCCTKHDSASLRGCFIDYKDYIAVLRSPSLRSALPVDLLGISGVVIADKAVLVGRRASYVTEYPGFYECVPSGGINPEMCRDGRVDPKVPFEHELVEEAGISKEDIVAFTLTGLVYDARAHLYEVTALIQLRPDLRRRPLAPSDEYAELFWVEFSELPAFFHDHGENLLPMSHYLLTSSALPA